MRPSLEVDNSERGTYNSADRYGHMRLKSSSSRFENSSGKKFNESLSMEEIGELELTDEEFDLENGVIESQEKSSNSIDKIIKKYSVPKGMLKKDQSKESLVQKKLF